MQLGQVQDVRTMSGSLVQSLSHHHCRPSLTAEPPLEPGPASPFHSFRRFTW